MRSGFKAAEVNGNSDDRAKSSQILKTADMTFSATVDAPHRRLGLPVCGLHRDPPSHEDPLPVSADGGTRHEAFSGQGEPAAPRLSLDDGKRTTFAEPSLSSARMTKIARMIDAQMQADEDGIDLIEAEEQAERDILAEREAALARQLAEMRGRKRKLVDPLQYAFSIAAEDLTNYDRPLHGKWHRPQRSSLNSWNARHLPGFRHQCRSCLAAHRQAETQSGCGLATPKQIRCLERYGFRQVGTWQFSRMPAALSRNLQTITGSALRMTPAIQALRRNFHGK
jgi:hypothetical protein